MAEETEDWRAANRALWDERTAIHLGPGGYDLTALRAGRGRLDAIAQAEIGPVDGLRVLHPQCHFGADTLTLAQQGRPRSPGWTSPAPPSPRRARWRRSWGWRAARASWRRTCTTRRPRWARRPGPSAGSS